MTSATLRTLSLQEIADNETRLREAVGRKAFLPKEYLTAETAAKALAGEIIVPSVKGFDYTPLNHKDPQWYEADLQVQRFLMCDALAAQYAETQNEELAQAARDYVESFIEVFARNPQINAGNSETLVLARRMDIWTCMLLDFSASPTFDERFVADVIDSVIHQLDFLLRNGNRLSPNIRLTEAKTLLHCGLRLRQLPQAEAWLAHAVRRINLLSRTQFLEDGAHVELNPRYNQVPLFLDFIQLGQHYPELGLKLNVEDFAPRYDYWIASRRPNGSTCAVHDSDGLEIGPRPEGWDKPYMDFRRAAGLPLEYPPTSQNFSAAGQAFWRTGWDEEATHATFDACRWGMYHTHLSRNALQIHAGGRSLLVDPGSLGYKHDCEWTTLGKSTRAHSTVNFNGWNQSYTPAERRFESIEGFDIATGYYTGGYWPGPCDWGFKQGHGRGLWGSHHRTFIWIRDAFFIVLDRVRHGDCGSELLPVTNLPTLESNWQFAADCRVEVDAQEMTAVTRHEDSNLLMLFPLCSAEGGRETVTPQLKVHSGEENPRRAWSLTDGEYVPAPQVCLSIEDATPWTDLATVLLPFTGPHQPQVSVEAEGGETGKLVIVEPDGTRHSLHYTHQLETPLDEIDGGYTDASLVYLRHSAAGDLSSGVIYDGTVAEPWTGILGDTPGLYRFQ
ncbi:MAG: heparinase II/III family protein [Planctomycetota bacterium]|jgi:hypothetical protein